MSIGKRLRAAGMILALAVAGLVAASVPAGADAGMDTSVATAEEVLARHSTKPTAVHSFTVPSASGQRAASCQLFRFGPMLGSAGVFVEWDVSCDFFAPGLGMAGDLRVAGNLVASRSVNCSGSSFCVLVVQASGCLTGALYQGRMDGLLQFPNGQILPFSDLAPPTAAGVRVC